LDLKTSLEKLERLRDLLVGLRSGKAEPNASSEMAELYGQLEELVLRLVGVNGSVQLRGPGNTLNTYSTYIESAIASGSGAHDVQAQAQLGKLIGKVRSLLEDPGAAAVPASVARLVTVLQRFRECCQYIAHPPTNEREVQDTLWIMLRSHFDYVEREETLARFGGKNYRPDFGVPELSTLVEVKFIGEKTDPARIQDEVLADIGGQLRATSKYVGIAFLVYDCAHKLRDPAPFVRSLKTIDGVVDVIVVPGIA
jgi:hypothetical protein